jgi:Zn finger protein HypA/HybF involved in hydrogenase expression
MTKLLSLWRWAMQEWHANSLMLKPWPLKIWLILIESECMDCQGFGWERSDRICPHCHGTGRVKRRT